MIDDNIFQKNFREISASDDIDKKTLAKMKKNAARDADIIWIMNPDRIESILNIF